MIIGVFVIVFVIVSLSPASLVLVLLVVVVIWFAFRSYRNWIANKSDEDVEHKTVANEGS